MTAEEAIKKMGKASTYTFAYDADPDEWFECFGVAIEALEKQIPKKPKDFNGVLTGYHICPCCGHNIPVYTVWCGVRGQAIKGEGDE